MISLKNNTLFPYMTISKNSNLCPQPDPKWEFPRTRLIIEQTLGEGEFGRVLRARALDIGGISGKFFNRKCFYFDAILNLQLF